MKKIVILLLVIVGISSCGKHDVKVPATGKPYEIFVITPKVLWDGVAGDTLRSFFEQPVAWLNQKEPLYDLYSMDPGATSEITMRHRNLIFMTVSDTCRRSQTTAQWDRNAKEQLIVNIVSPSVDSLARYIGEYGATMVALFDKAERDRMLAKGTAYRDATIGDKIEQTFGFTMNIPKGYRIRESRPGFLWISYEMPLSSQGVIIYTFPYTPQMSGKEIIAQRNAAVGRVPGPSKGSYMTTELMFGAEFNSVLINGVRWAETKGFWKVENDFMGGPYVNYTTYDPATGGMVGIDLYVSAPDPKESKRNYLRQLESLVLSVRFKAANPAVDAGDPAPATSFDGVVDGSQKIVPVAVPTVEE